MDLRCASKKHAELIEPSADSGILEIKCDSDFCGARRGVVVLHRFDLMTGQLTETHKYAIPKKGAVHDTGESHSVRHP